MPSISLLFALGSLVIVAPSHSVRAVTSSPVASTASAEEKSITLIVAGDKETARDRVLTAFVEDGLTPAEGSNTSVIATMPEEVAGGFGMRGSVTYRVTLIGSGDSTRVVFTAWLVSQDAQALAKAMSSLEMPSGARQLTSAWRGAGKKAWDRMATIAERVRATS